MKDEAEHVLLAHQICIFIVQYQITILTKRPCAVVRNEAQCMPRMDSTSLINILPAMKPQVGKNVNYGNLIMKH